MRRIIVRKTFRHSLHMHAHTHARARTHAQSYLSLLNQRNVR